MKTPKSKVRPKEIYLSFARCPRCNAPFKIMQIVKDRRPIRRKKK